MPGSEANSTGFHIVLLRHGQSEGNAAGYHQGQHDFNLTETGRKQACALANRWLRERITFDRIISSPLRRASETAEIIASSLSVALDFDPVWMERDNGILAGHRPEEVANLYPQPAFVHPYLPIGETGESQWDLYLRAGRAVQSLVCRPPGRYLAVSHGGILNMVLYAILGIVPQANFHGPRFGFRNTAFATLTYEPNQHKWRLLGLNDRNHWRDESSES